MWLNSYWAKSYWAGRYWPAGEQRADLLRDRDAWQGGKRKKLPEPLKFPAYEPAKKLQPEEDQELIWDEAWIHRNDPEVIYAVAPPSIDQAREEGLRLGLSVRKLAKFIEDTQEAEDEWIIAHVLEELL